MAKWAIIMFDVDNFIIKLGESESKELPDFQLEKLDEQAIKLKINKDLTLDEFEKIIKFDYVNDKFFEEFICSNKLFLQLRVMNTLKKLL